MSARLEFSTTHRYVSQEDAITVPITLRAGVRSLEVVAKLDTGSDFCIFERRCADVLRLDLEAASLQRFRTATGVFTAFARQVQICTFDAEFISTVYFAEDPDFSKNIVGRHGWLDRFRVGIIDHDQLLYLNDYDS